jgi:hypothetical protein
MKRKGLHKVFRFAKDGILFVLVVPMVLLITLACAIQYGWEFVTGESWEDDDDE